MNVNPPNLGSITVRCQMLNEHLRVEVLNARNLKPPDLQAGKEICCIYLMLCKLQSNWDRTT